MSTDTRLRNRTTSIHRLRSVQNSDGTHTISGYAALYNVLSEELAPGVRERLAPGCFDNAVQTSDIRCLYNHDSNFLLGRQSTGTLIVGADNLGLYYECTVPDTSYAKDIAVLMQRGDLKENSFAFTVDPDNIDVEQMQDGSSVETIRSVQQLYDVSIVVTPAYPQTFSVYRSAEAIRELAQAFGKAAQAADLFKDSTNSESRTTNEGNERTVENRSIETEIAIIKAKLELANNSIEV